MLKKCKKCGEEKEANTIFFRPAKRYKDGLFSWCRTCSSEYEREHYKKNHNKIINRKRESRQNNVERYREYVRKYRRSNTELVKSRNRLCRQKRYKNNSDKINLQNRLRRKNNPDKFRLYDLKQRSTPMGRINDSISSSIRRMLKGNKAGHKWTSLLGYDSIQLVKHLEKQFTEGMTWENYGKWHIDHIIPVSVFNFSSPEHIDFKRCWALKNLRPLWAKENLQKRAKISMPFQPSLEI